MDGMFIEACHISMPWFPCKGGMFMNCWTDVFVRSGLDSKYTVSFNS